jgi:hypothetical protein
MLQNRLISNAEAQIMEIEVASIKPAGESIQGFGSSAQWGLASLLIRSVVFMASPVLLVFNTIFSRQGRYGVPMGLAWTASMIGVAAILAMGVASIVFGTRGWLIAGRERQCPALAVAGTFMSIAAVVSWLIVSIDLIIVLATL